MAKRKNNDDASDETTHDTDQPQPARTTDELEADYRAKLGDFQDAAKAHKSLGIDLQKDVKKKLAEAAGDLEAKRLEKRQAAERWHAALHAEGKVIPPI